MRREGKIQGKTRQKEGETRKKKRIRFNKKGISNFPIHIEVNSIPMFPLE